MCPPAPQASPSDSSRSSSRPPGTPELCARRSPFRPLSSRDTPDILCRTKPHLLPPAHADRGMPLQVICASPFPRHLLFCNRYGCKRTLFTPAPASPCNRASAVVLWHVPEVHGIRRTQPCRIHHQLVAASNVLCLRRMQNNMLQSRPRARLAAQPHPDETGLPSWTR
jgi:hypothetical protein